MSIPIASTTAAMTGSLPIVNQAFEPVAVRNGSPATQKAYAAALGFEQMLVQQLAESMTAASGMGGEESSAEAGDTASESSPSGLSAGNSQLSSMLPQALTEGVMSQGGLGLATQLMGKLETGKSVTKSGGVSS